MSKQTEALKLALEALEIEESQTAYPGRWLTNAITALREALASEAIEQPAQQQEPVAWLKVTEHWLSGMPKLEIAKPQEQGAKPVYLNPYQLT